MNSIQQNTQKSNIITRLRPNLYQLPHGQLVGFGPVEAENGLQWCYNCQEPECSHVEAITQAWLDGMSVEAQSIPFNGVAPEDDEGMIFASSAGMWPDDLGLSEPTL